MKKIYVTLKDLAEFYKIDKELMTDYLLDKKYLKKENNLLKITDKGSGAGIHEVNGKYGKFLLFDKSMNLYDLIRFRKYGSDNKKKKGDKYEQFIAKYYTNGGYIVRYNGCEEGSEDNSIDLIAVNKNEVLLIQCKNWSFDWVKKNNKFITNKDIKSFYGDALNYVEKNKHLKEWKIKYIFVCSSPIFSKDAIAYMKNEGRVDFLIKEMKLLNPKQ